MKLNSYYNRLILVNSLKNELNKYFKDNVLKKATKCMSNWIKSMIVYTPVNPINKRVDNIFINALCNHEINIKFIDELIDEKVISYGSEFKEILKHLIELINEYLIKISKSHIIHIETYYGDKTHNINDYFYEFKNLIISYRKNNKKVIKYLDFESEIDYDIYTTLQNCYLGKNYLLALTKLLINYECINLVKYDANNLVNDNKLSYLTKCGNILEVVTSPLESQILLNPNNIGNYCSLFQENISFGSIGRFMDLRPDQLQFECIIINNPVNYYMIEQYSNLLYNIMKNNKFLQIAICKNLLFQKLDTLPEYKVFELKLKNPNSDKIQNLTVFNKNNDITDVTNNTFIELK